jgi:hypothetical protein
VVDDEFVLFRNGFVLLTHKEPRVKYWCFEFGGMHVGLGEGEQVSQWETVAKIGHQHNYQEQNDQG